MYEYTSKRIGYAAFAPKTDVITSQGSMFGHRIPFRYDFARLYILPEQGTQRAQHVLIRVFRAVQLYSVRVCAIPQGGAEAFSIPLMDKSEDTGGEPFL